MKYYQLIFVVCFLGLLGACQGINQDTLKQLEFSQATLERVQETTRVQNTNLIEEIKVVVEREGIISMHQIALDAIKLRKYTNSVKEKIESIASSNETQVSVDSLFRANISSFNAYLDTLAENHQIEKVERFTFDENEFKQKHPVIISNLLIVKQLDLYKLEHLALRQLLDKTRASRQKAIKAIAYTPEDKISLGEDFIIEFGLHEVYLSDDMQVTCNGDSMKVKDGIGQIKVKADQVGTFQLETKVAFRFPYGRNTVFRIEKRYKVIPQ